METQHYCLLTEGAVKIKSGPLWFWGPAQNYPYCYSDNSDAISVIIFLISYSNNVSSPLEKLIIWGQAHFAQLDKSALIHDL